MAFSYSVVAPLVPAAGDLIGTYSSPYHPNYNDYNMQSIDESYLNLTLTSVDSGQNCGVTALAFDNYEELLWMGNEAGHVTSFHTRLLDKYTSFRVHTTERIEQIATLEAGLLLLTGSSLRWQIRRGIPKHTHRSENLNQMLCMLEASPQRFLIGGLQDGLVEFDLNSLRETKLYNVGPNGCTVMRKNLGYLFASDKSGDISLRDLNTMQLEHRIRTHASTLSDFDVQGNYLVSCGFSGQHSNISIDQFLIVYDLRMLQEIAHIPLRIFPQMLRFLPSQILQLAAVSSYGEIQLININDPTNNQAALFQVGSNSNECICFDVSSSSQVMAVGDRAGQIITFSHASQSEPVFNLQSRDTVFPNIEAALPPMPFSEENIPLSTIALPPLETGSTWFSDWPKTLLHYRYFRPKPIDPDILKNMKMQGPIGHALNPKTVLRNQIPYINDSTDDPSGVLNGANMATQAESAPKKIPRKYRKVEINYTKLGVQDIDFRIYNQTNFAGLEATLPNSYCNSMLQVLYYISPLRRKILEHSCLSEYCLSCELGFLFNMLDRSTAPCQANNFLRSFRTIPEAAALGLILTDRASNVDLIGLIQNWNCFVLRQMHCEMSGFSKRNRNASNTSKHQIATEANETHVILSDKACDDSRGSEAIEETEISKIFGIKQVYTNLCLKCENQETNENIAFACDLSYPTNGTDASLHYNFSSILQRSLVSVKDINAYCKNCKMFRATKQSVKTKQLPQVLSINCGLTKESDLNFLKDHLNDSTVGLTKSVSSSQVKRCRYGRECMRRDCRFQHDDTPKQSAERVDKAANGFQCPWFPLEFTLSIQENGELVVETDPGSSLSGGEDGVDGSNDISPNSTLFSLQSVVCQIDDGQQKNLVALVQVGKSYQRMRLNRGKSVHSSVEETPHSWYIFNDFSVSPVCLPEPVWFTLEWKVPCVLVYSCMRDDDDNYGDNEVFRPESPLVQSPAYNPFIEDTLSLLNISNGSADTCTIKPLQLDEMPRKGDLVAIDAEFVTLNPEENEIRPDGKTSIVKPCHMSVARISCIRGQGPLEGTPFIDDYISTQEKVADYLTQFSGIKPGDLDANLSRKHLTALKYSYQRLKHLVDVGVQFIGHGLKNDFRVINIHVPSAQIIDTVRLFQIPRQRMISLRFLVWHFLGIKIQSETHDSIEDARAALALYKFYLQLKASNKLDAALKDVYARGAILKWQVPDDT